jgi:hypothetical protein
MTATLFIGLLIMGIFAWELGSLWWRETEWRRRWRNRRDED